MKLPANNRLAGFTRKPIPRTVKPMLAALSDKPFDNKDWVFEIKFDGYRVISIIKNGKASLLSRNQKPFDDLFPSIKKELQKLEHDIVIDGETVAVSKEGKPVFQLLQRYKKTGNGTPVYYVFDLLWYDGYDLTRLPLKDRKMILKSLIKGLNNIFYSEHIAGKGKALYSKAEKMGFEGIIAKKADSFYYENSRSQSWLKIKITNTLDAVICGYTEPRGSRKFFGALVLGLYDSKKLIYIGHTGTGFDHGSQRSLYSLMNKYRSQTSPFDITPKTNMPAVWLKPKLVCEVKYSHFTKDGILRHPVFLTMRDDKKPIEAQLKQQVKNG
jgi:bifunctional non-homologous end joining protein LigD